MPVPVLPERLVLAVFVVEFVPRFMLLMLPEFMLDMLPELEFMLDIGVEVAAGVV